MVNYKQREKGCFVFELLVSFVLSNVFICGFLIPLFIVGNFAILYLGSNFLIHKIKKMEENSGTRGTLMSVV